MPQNRPLAPSTASGPPSSRRKAGSLLCKITSKPLHRICRNAHLRGGAGWDFLPKARPWSKHVPLWLWLRCRYPAGRAGLLDAGSFLRVLLAKAKKPARSRFGICLGWCLRTGLLCCFALAIAVSGGYLPQNRPLAPSTASGPPSSRRKAGSLLCRIV